VARTRHRCRSVAGEPRCCFDPSDAGRARRRDGASASESSRSRAAAVLGLERGAPVRWLSRAKLTLASYAAWADEVAGRPARLGSSKRGPSSWWYGVQKDCCARGSILLTLALLKRRVRAECEHAVGKRITVSPCAPRNRAQPLGVLGETQREVLSRIVMPAIVDAPMVAAIV